MRERRTSTQAIIVAAIAGVTTVIADYVVPESDYRLLVKVAIVVAITLVSGLLVRKFVR